MSLPEAIERKCVEVLGSPILDARFVGGGDIGVARLLRTENGRFFLKYSRELSGFFPFEAEARGLELLRNASPIRIPEVIFCDKTFLLLEYIEPGLADNSFWENFGLAFSELHRNTSSFFGLEFDNYIGRLSQTNSKRNLWPDFFREMRLEPQSRQAFDLGYFTTRDIAGMGKLYRNLPEIFPPEKPALVHGDLWSGNYLVSHAGEPVLIDPAVSYSHREMDLAMSRLFGGFDWRFYRSYEEAYPLAPGFEERLPVYQLYYLLVHVNLFGAAYLGPVRDIMSRWG